MARTVTSAAVLPLYTLNLVRRYWASLLCVYAVGTFLHLMMMRGVVQLGLIHPVLGSAGVSIALLITLVTTILMFHLLRPGLPVLDNELVRRMAKGRTQGQSGQGGSFRDGERRVVDAVAMAILPFLIFYSAWGLIGEEYREFATGALNQGGIAGYSFAASDTGQFFGVYLALALGCLAIRLVLERFYKRGNSPWLGVLTAVFESSWLFFAAFSVNSIWRDAVAWVSSRVVWVELKAGVVELAGVVGEMVSLPLPTYLAALGAFLGFVWATVKDGMFEPLLWLTIAAVVFGAEVDDVESLFGKNRRVRRVTRLASNVPRLVPGVFTAMGKFVGTDLRDKYQPFLNAFRLILSAGPVFYLSFSLYYVLLELSFGWLERWVYVLVGPEDLHAWWWPWLGVVEFGVGALHELLRIALLAAAFELILRQLGSQGSGRRGRPATDQTIHF